MADHVLERRAVEQGGRHDVQQVEPAAGLADVFHDVVGREVLLELLLVLERVVELRERHGTGLEPAVEHIGNTVHVRLAGRVVRVDADQVVNPRTVHVDVAVLVARVVTEVGLELFERTVNVHTRVLRIVTHPHRNRGTPEAVAGDGPVARVGEPLAELAVLDVARDPVDLLVQFQQTRLDLGHGHEPGGDRLVDQRGGATPAVRVGVHVALLLEEDRAALFRNLGERAVAGAQVAQDRQVGVEHEIALVVGALRGEAAAIVEHVGALDALGVQRVHIVFTVGGLVNQTGTFDGVDVVGGEDRVAVRAGHMAFGFGLVAREVREDRVVAAAFQLGALEFAHDLVVLAEFLLVVRQQVLAEVELLASELAFGRADLDVVDVGADHDGEVGGHGPRGGGPEDGVGVVLIAHLHGHGHGGVLAVLVHVGVHAQLVRTQRRAVLRAVRQHAVALVGQALVVELLEGPHHGFHVRDVQGLVAVLEVHPTGLTMHVVLPFVGVLQHRSAAGVVELVDAHLLDLVDRVDAELLLRLKLGGQAVGVPAEHAVDLAALHGLVARDHVLGVAGQQVAVVRQAIGERRAIEEHEFVLAVVAGRVAFNGLLEGVVLVPVVENGLLHVGEAGVRRDVRGLAALVRLGIYVFAHRKSPVSTVHWSYRSVIDGDCRAPTCAGWVHECHVPNRGADRVNRLAAGTDCVPPGTALSAVPAYEDDDGRWYALRTAVPPRLSHRLRRSELLHSEPRACATACVRLSRADPVGSTGRLPPFFRRLPADNGSLPHNGAYRNTPRGQINENVHQE